MRAERAAREPARWVTGAGLEVMTRWTRGERRGSRWGWERHTDRKSPPAEMGKEEEGSRVEDAAGIGVGHEAHQGRSRRVVRILGGAGAGLGGGQRARWRQGESGRGTAEGGEAGQGARRRGDGLEARQRCYPPGQDTLCGYHYRAHDP